MFATNNKTFSARCQKRRATADGPCESEPQPDRIAGRNKKGRTGVTALWQIPA